MIPDDVVRLPAGWYPDPTGLPQLRWWDNHAWTQHTIAARQPLIVQEQPLAWAEDLPTRRERREREREDRGTDDLTPPTAQSLLELAPPSADEEPADEPAPAEEPDLPASDRIVQTRIVQMQIVQTRKSSTIARTTQPPTFRSRRAVMLAASRPFRHSTPPARQPLSRRRVPAPRASSACAEFHRAAEFHAQAPPSQANPPTVGTPLFDQVSAGIADAPATTTTRILGRRGQ